MSAGISADNARLLARAFRTMISNPTTSSATCTQGRTVYVLESVKYNKDIEVVLRITVVRPHDRYVSEMRDVTNVSNLGDRLIVETEGAELCITVFDGEPIDVPAPRPPKGMWVWIPENGRPPCPPPGEPPEYRPGPPFDRPCGCHRR